MSTPEEKIAALVKKQAGLKSYTTVCMNKLNALDDEKLKIHFKSRKATILNQLQKVQRVEGSIIEIYDQGDESVEERKLSEMTSQIEYNHSVHDELTLIERQIDDSPPANSNPPLQPSLAVKIPMAIPKTNWNSRILLLNFPIVLMLVVHCPLRK